MCACGLQRSRAIESGWSKQMSALPPIAEARAQSGRDPCFRAKSTFLNSCRNRCLSSQGPHRQHEERYDTRTQHSHIQQQTPRSVLVEQSNIQGICDVIRWQDFEHLTKRAIPKHKLTEWSRQNGREENEHAADATADACRSR